MPVRKVAASGVHGKLQALQFVYKYDDKTVRIVVIIVIVLTFDSILATRIFARVLERYEDVQAEADATRADTCTSCGVLKATKR